MQRLGWFLAGEDGVQALTDAVALPAERSGFTVAFVYLANDAVLKTLGGFPHAEEKGVPIIRASEGNAANLPDFDLGIVAGAASCPMAVGPVLILSHAPPERNGATQAEEIWRAMEERASSFTVYLLVCLPDGTPAIATSCRFSLQERDWEPLWRQFYIKLKNESMEEIALMGTDEMLFRRIQSESRRREVSLIALSAKLFDEDMASIKDGKLMRDGAPQERGLDLSAAVESALAQGRFTVD